MTLDEVFLGVLWAGLTLYVLLAGADFGAGLWDLLAGGTQRGMPVRALIAESLGPIWEANHVWLIFVIVLMWTGFPSAFAAIASTAYIPLTLVALGIIGRGAAFAFRGASEELRQQRLFGAVFALSSVVTPFFLGTVAGAIASRRIPPGIARGDIVTSWWNPTSVAIGLLGVGVGAYLAAVYLTRDAARHAPELVEGFRRRALASGVTVGGLAVAGLLVLRADAPELYDPLLHGRGAPLVGVSVAAGLASLGLLVARRFLAVRVTAGLAAAAVLWAWAAAQSPTLLPGLTVSQAAAPRAVLEATLAAVGVGALLLLPSLWWLFRIFQGAHEPQVAPDGSPDGGGAPGAPTQPVRE
jgi:cytochrome bd ubiquinol oxidase subunit II